MESLKAEKEIPKGSKILQFSLFLDEEGLIRAKGRVGKSQLEKLKSIVGPHDVSNFATLETSCC